MADHDDGVRLFFDVARLLTSRESCASCDCIGLAKAIGSLARGAPAHLQERIIAQVNAEIRKTMARASPAGPANGVRGSGEAVH